METYKYKNWTIHIDYDQSGTDPTEWGNYTIDNMRVPGPKSKYYDQYGNLTIGARAMIKSGRLWPVTYSEHGLCAYTLGNEYTADAWLEFEPGYIEGISKSDRQEYAEQAIDTAIEWDRPNHHTVTAQELHK